MISIQVIGEDTSIAFAGSQGNFELNAMRPIIINNFLHSATILADGCEKFTQILSRWYRSQPRTNPGPTSITPSSS